MSRKDESSAVTQEDKNNLLFCMNKGPGPAVYKLKTLTGASDHCWTKPQAPSYSIGLNRNIRNSDTPGPPAYRYHSSLTSRGLHLAPAASLKGRPKPSRGTEIQFICNEEDTDGRARVITDEEPVLHVDCTNRDHIAGCENFIDITEEFPGPGAYDYKSLSQLTPRLTMGLPIKTSTKTGPSPNAYEVKDGIGSSAVQRQSVPAWGVRSRTFYGSCYYDATKAAVPGPATYRPVNNRSNGFTIKSRVPYNDPLCNSKPGPAPGAYDPLERSKSSRGFSMGIRHSPHVMPVIGAYDMIY